MYGLVDQVIVDENAKVIDIRVANTTGTSNPVNWIFTNRVGFGGLPEEMTMRRTGPDTLVAAGIDSAGAYSFRLAGEHLSFGVTYSVPDRADTWRCAK